MYFYSYFVLGTESLIKKIPVDTLNDLQPDDKCNKDTGEKGRLRQRARGHFAAVTGGGNIICFNPIYKYAFTDSYMYIKLFKF